MVIDSSRFALIAAGGGVMRAQYPAVAREAAPRERSFLLIRSPLLPSRSSAQEEMS
jgi:hypothetical protein